MKLDKSKLFQEQSNLKALQIKRAIAKAQIKNNENEIKKKIDKDTKCDMFF